MNLAVSATNATWPIDTDDCAGIRIKMALSTLMPFRECIPHRRVSQFEIEHEIGGYVRYWRWMSSITIRSGISFH